MKENKKEIKNPLFGLLFSQFIGAFNDNAWKIMVFTLATRALIQNGMDKETFEYASQIKATLALLVFLIPMLIFSFPAGAIADRVSKRSMIIVMKVLEVVLLAAGAFCLFFMPTNLFFAYAVLGLMGMQSALFSPAKYGILPQILPYEKLAKGNGLIEMWTMIAIIAGTGLGPLMLVLDKEGTRPDLSYTGPLALMILSIAGLAASFLVPKVNPVKEESSGFIKTIKDAGTSIYRDRVLLLAVLGTIFFWLNISLLGQNVLVYAKGLVQHLERGELYQGVPPASYGIGIAIGALLGGKISGDRIEYGLIPLGAIGFAAMSLVLGIVQPLMAGTVVTLIMLGISSGMVVVPLQSLVQWRAPHDQKGAIIGLANAFNIFGMIIGSVAASAMAVMGLNLEKTLVVSALLVVAATIWSVKLLPEALTRLLFIILTNTFYKIRIVGEENIPKEGAALIVSNHLSATDAFFVMAAIDRPIRFVMSDKHFNKWWFRPFALAMDAIPVAFDEDSNSVQNALRGVNKHLKRGHLVCLFPEGTVSRTGMLQPFREELKEIMNRRNCPIIPIYLDRVWGTIFSPKGGRYIPRRPQNIPHPLTVIIGRPLSDEATTSEVRRVIRKLGSEAWLMRNEDEEPIFQHFIRSVFRAPWKTVLIDERGEKRSRIITLSAAINLARKLKKQAPGEETVGIMLPTSFDGIAANLAVTMSGRCAVNIRYGKDMQSILHILDKSKVRTIITSKSLLEAKNIGLPQHIRCVFVENLIDQLSAVKLFTAAVAGLTFPKKILDSMIGSVKAPNPASPLTIIFTSGATAAPKGVVLSHFNVSSNVEGVSQVVPSTGIKDRLLHALPLSHALGYMTMWLGLNHSLPFVLVPNPANASFVAKAVREYKVSMLWTTPSLLKIYLEQVPPEAFGSLKFVLTGGEKLPQKLAEEFHDKFGISPVEGYGCAECSAVISTNTLDIRLPGVYQAGSQKGSVGQPLPGVRVKIVDPATFKEVPCGESGLLIVKGPNIMINYLDNPEMTKEAIRDGWYITQDIATQDDHDFITLLDRKERFIKANEKWIPLSVIEETLHHLAKEKWQSFALTVLKDQFLGDKIAIVHTVDQKIIASLLEEASRHEMLSPFGLKEDNFFQVEKLPHSPAGKIDFSQLGKLALLKDRA